jgi:hypothetical protein
MVMVDRSRILKSRLCVQQVCLSMVLLLTAFPSAATAQKERRQSGASSQPTSSPSASNLPVSVPPAANAKTQREPIWVDDADAKRGDAYFRRVLDLPATEQAYIEFESTETCEVFLNGLRVGNSRGPGAKEKADVSSLDIRTLLEMILSISK